ncbi:multidrug efflux SMR transporter [Isoptericola sp. b515]|uniref:DMT family transporter n=1 Tax=Isoptericola sp. b515 TaxID=3064652 RepID=UPI0027122A05|nr:multidrug efflux SMR transporter [Isoptericola sp. b515]MDO8147181.1 multidrug efflux SMR transporter [Isoptericola sp. b515]
MPWLILLLSAVAEAVWATALGESEGFSVLGPTIVFFVFLAISMAGLGWAVRRIPLGTAYAVWVGLGAALTVSYAMATGGESVSALKVVFLLGIVGAVIGLKLVPHDAPAVERDVDVRD